jgi:beta-lactamase regulating signal transducer with metallopeptidase domain
MNTIDGILKISDSAFVFILNYTIQISLLIVFAAVMCRILRHSTAASRSIVWNLVFIGIIILPAIGFITPSWNITSPTISKQISELQTAAQIPESSEQNKTLIMSLNDEENSQSILPASAEINKINYSSLIAIIINVVLLGGIIASLARLASGHLKLLRIIRTAHPETNSTISKIYRKIRASHGIKSNANVFLSGSVCSPVTDGIFRPKIILPSDCHGWQEERLISVLLHEIAHIHRNDVVINVVSGFVKALNWFNPLVYFALNQLLFERENACDDVVLNTGIKSQKYASYLFESARQLSANKQVLTAGVSAVSQSILEKRIKLILAPNQRRKSTHPFQTALIVVAIFSFLILLSGMDLLQNVKSDLSHVLTFGAENIPDEYLLAQPWGIAVGNNDDIFVTDESKIKVYDKSGSPKSNIGSKGQGPGEFEFTPQIWILPEGYLTLRDINFSLFSSDKDFIKRISSTFFFNSDDIKKSLEIEHFDPSMNKSVFLNESDILVSGNGWKNDQIIANTEIINYSILVLMKNNSPTTIAKYTTNNVVKGRTKTGWSRVSHRYISEFYWDVLPDQKVVYTHTGYDKKTSDTENSYILHITDLNSLVSTELEIQYTPAVIPDSVIDKAILPWGNEIHYEDKKPYADDLRRKLKAAKYLPPVKKIIADGNYIFVFIYQNDHPGMDEAHLIDANKKELLSTVLFPSMPKIIKNGYAYYFGKNEDGFTVVEKYKIASNFYR